MDWLTTLAGVWITTLGWMAAAAVVLAVLSRLWPCNPGRSWWADLRAARTDLGYWLLNPALTGAGRVGLLVAGTLLVYGGEPPADLPARRLPLWAQCGLVLLIQDVILYAVHRAFHTRRGWGFHAVHHSPEPLDWPSALRFHPVNAVLEFAAADAAVLLMGFSPTALLALAPFSLAFSVLVHANLDWTFGPLRYVIASPVFHRWHHTSAEAGRDRNFASTFPFLDLLFGTFYLPAGERPRAYGAGDPAFPAGLWAQWAYPFRRAGGRAAAAVGGAAGCLAVAVGMGVGLTPRLADELVAADAPPAAPGHLPAALLRPPTAVAVLPDGRTVEGAADGSVRVRAAGGAVVACRGGGRRVNGLAASRDGRRVAAADADGAARVWDAASGELLTTLRGDAGTPLAVALDRDGRRVVTGTADGTVRVWEVAGGSGRTLGTGGGPVQAVAVSDDGARVAAARGREATVWDAVTGRAVVLRGHADLVYAVAISPDGRRVATGGYDARVVVWDAATGASTTTLTGPAGPVYAVAVADDGRVAAGGADRAVRVWTGGRAEVHAGPRADVTALAFGPAGRVVAAGRDGTVTGWDAATGGVLPAGGSGGR